MGVVPPPLPNEPALVAVPAFPVTLMPQVPYAFEPAASAAVYPNAVLILVFVK